MNTLSRSLSRCILASSLLAVSPAAAQSASRPRGWGEAAVKAELHRRGTADQAIRDTVMQSMQTGASLDTFLIRRQILIDADNTTWLRRELTQRGWPSVGDVGRGNVEYAFLIVQHATHDTAFQAAALTMIEAARERGDATGEQVALLSDRLALAQGRKQRFGTQAYLSDGKLVFKPIEDSAGVDRRRSSIGLPPLADYLTTLQKMYGKQPPD